jgi:hypothetical protein
MRHPVQVGIILAEVVVGLALARLVAKRRAPDFVERVGRTVRGRVSPEQMESLLGRCHGLLETTSVRQRVSQAAAPTTVRVA